MNYAEKTCEWCQRYKKCYYPLLPEGPATPGVVELVVTSDHKQQSDHRS